MTTPDSAAPTVDAFLGGRVEALQPARGHHRAGLEAVLLGAALPKGFGLRVVDLGAGVGVAGLCHVARDPMTTVTLVERKAELADLARQALRRPANGAFAARVTVAAVDIGAAGDEREAAGFIGDAADAVLTNPPFYPAGTVRASPSTDRADAHVLDGRLDAWFRASVWALRPAGSLVMIAPASSLPEIVAGADGRFGRLTLLPVHPRPGAAAHRLLIAAVKGSRAAPVILPGLVLHGEEGSAFTPAVDTVLRDGAWLGDAHPPWRVAVGSPT